MSRKNGRKTHAVWGDDNYSTSGSSTLDEGVRTRTDGSLNVDLMAVPSNIATMANGDSLLALEQKSRSSSNRGDINRNRYGGFVDDNMEKVNLPSYRNEQEDTDSDHSSNLRQFLPKDEGENEDNFSKQWSQEGNQNKQKRKKLGWLCSLESNKSKNGFWNKRSMIFVVLFIVALMATIVTMGVVAFKRDDAIKGDVDPSRVGASREYTLNQILARISDSVALQTKGTPQYSAREWLIFEDNLQVTPGANMTYTRIAQRYALAVFYFSTRGEDSWRSNNWMWGEECEGLLAWEGISCSPDGHVRSLAFDNHGLSGTIPEEIFELHRLENLVLKNNPELKGTIPKSIGKLRILGQLGLYNNALTGTIPYGLFDATRLNYINLENNKISGRLALRVMNLKRLHRLILSNNMMTGSVSMPHLAGTQLKYLALSNNKFSGTISKAIADLSNLEYLYLDGNDFSGGLPGSTGELTQLKSINLDSNSFVGKLPKSLANLQKLEFLSMQDNNLSGEIPVEMSGMSKLETMNIAMNSLGGSLPDLSNFSKLRNLHLYENSLIGTIPDSVAGLKNIEVLFLSSNQLTGAIPSAIGTLDRTLRGLYLSDNKLDGNITQALCELDELESLFLDENKFYGELPDCLNSMSSLRQFYVFQNELSGEVPSNLQDLKLLSGLGLEGNAFVGEISQGICALTADPLVDLWADCGGSSPTLSCSCCSACCPGAHCA